MGKTHKRKFSNGVIVFQDDQIEAFLKSEEVQKALDSVAETVKERAGEGYEVGQAEDKVLKTRAIATVYARTGAAKQDNLENNTLLKAAGTPVN